MAQWNRSMDHRPFNPKSSFNGHRMETGRPPPLMSHGYRDDPMSEAPLPRPPLPPPPPPAVHPSRAANPTREDDLGYDYDAAFMDRRPPPLMPEDYYQDNNPPLPELPPPQPPPPPPPPHLNRPDPHALNDYPQPSIIHDDQASHRYPTDEIIYHDDHLMIRPPHIDDVHTHDYELNRRYPRTESNPISHQYDDYNYDYPHYPINQRPQQQQPPIRSSLNVNKYPDERIIPNHQPIPPSPHPYIRPPNIGHNLVRPPAPSHSAYPSATPNDWLSSAPTHQPPLPPPQRQPMLPPPLPPPQVSIPLPMTGRCDAKKSQSAPDSVTIDSILLPTTRNNRPAQIAIIIRGLPGSGKTHLAKLIKEKEIANGGNPPRILSLDDYFLTEVEKTIKDPNTGKVTKTKATEYAYEKEMEDVYRASLFKSFCRTVDEGFFSFIMVDDVHNKASQFLSMWQHAKKKDFEVYVAEITADAHECATRSTHGRTENEIEEILSSWEETPEHIKRVDVRSLLQEALINEVEMDCGDSSSNDEAISNDEVSREKKEINSKVKWADIEEESQRKRRRQVGFVIGTDWKDLTLNENEVNELSGSHY
ncbi:uncharacterized protein TRIADDRAFT_51811 [Trichoplax adhaerens]|uniref:YLP motif-containing protein 1 n=1 Tax=Trichoplax adhaerens TaxID=10228 RepID=B3RKY5_TRIAD|nr:hypothetical protein TRIADDRAFT_51811 [Trichoplax adhaerens]EDV29456.1 hypothetical protein TRIADDRAFT_51811 [Trichoplax adhaerens]|eukprot:XP_002108658.1 hypothetical protein TRIADDRAFT_51811 [Trichoplax adhaerens]